MSPLTDGYYLSEQFHTEEMHAGVRMQDDFYRFLKFFPGGLWLWSDRNRDDFDFATLVRHFDLPHWRANHRRESPPTSRERDGAYLFQFGTYRSDGDQTVVSFFCPLAEMEFSYNVSVTQGGTCLTGWKHAFDFHPDLT